MDFPNSWYKYVWRNWDLVPVERLAASVGATADALKCTAVQMGLPDQSADTAHIFLRNRYSLLKRNWDVLPLDQICELVGMTWGEMRERLLDDNIYHKLGPKPECRRLTYADSLVVPEEETSDIKRTAERMHAAVKENAEPRYAFIADLVRPQNDAPPEPAERPRKEETVIDSSWAIRMAECTGRASIRAAKELQQFLWSGLGVKLPYSRARSEESVPQGLERFIVCKLNKSGEGAADESFTLTIHSDSVTVTASSDRGLMRGIHEIEERLRRRGGPFLEQGTTTRRPALTPRIIFSYFTVYGDGLIGEDGDAYPEGYLARLSRMGFNAIWMSAYLRDLVKVPQFPEFGEGSDVRIANLNALVSRAAEYGIDVYLYSNEPRGMREKFYDAHPHVKGHGPYPDLLEGHGNWVDANFYAMCTSTSEVKLFLRDGVRQLFERSPGLKGLITITASESITNCYSRGNPFSTLCPRCAERNPSEVVAEVVNLMRLGAKEAKPDAEVIAWSWSWNNYIEPEPSPRIISMIDPDVPLMTDFERGLDIRVGNHVKVAEEYCISRPGPSERTLTHRRLSAERGMKFYAKINLSNTLECGSIPYIPVPGLILAKMKAMRETGIEGVMASWSFGSYPSPNTHIFREYAWLDQAEDEELLHSLAAGIYGESGANKVLAAWAKFAEGFALYPFSITLIYTSPVQFGPAYKFSFHPSPTTTGVYRPGEDYKLWTLGFEPAEVVASYDDVLLHWEQGLSELEEALAFAPNALQETARKDYGVALAAAIIMRTTRNAIVYLMQRDLLFDENAGMHERLAAAANMDTVLREEIASAERFYRLVSADSRLGYESAQQYFYRPLDIIENRIGCERIVEGELPAYVRRLRGINGGEGLGQVIANQG